MTTRHWAALRRNGSLSVDDLTGQVLGFWLQTIRTDVALGSTAAIEQNLSWLVRLRSGQDLPFDDAMVQRMFDDLSAEIDARLDSRAAAAVRRLPGGSSGSSCRRSPAVGRSAMELKEYLEHLLAGEDAACLAEARAMARDLDGLHRLYVEVIQPSQYRVGELWEAGELSVASEHLATAINSFVANSCYAPLARADVGGPRALIACTPEELHELGPRMLADLLECDGWDVDFYGSSRTERDSDRSDPGAGSRASWVSPRRWCCIWGASSARSPRSAGRSAQRRHLWS